MSIEIPFRASRPGAGGRRTVAFLTGVGARCLYSGMDISVVITTHDRADLVGATIDSVLAAYNQRGLGPAAEPVAVESAGGLVYLPRIVATGQAAAGGDHCR